MADYKSLLQEGLQIGVANTSPAMDGEVLTAQDLKDMVEYTNTKGNKPYIAIGHDGVFGNGREKAVGWIDPNSLEFRENEGILYVTPESVSDETIRSIENGEYSKLSIEYSFTNPKDIEIYDSTGNRLSDIEGISRYYMSKYADDTGYIETIFESYDTNIYDKLGDRLEHRDVFKAFLNGVAILGRKTPAYPQFNISEKIRHFKDNLIVRSNSISIESFITEGKEVLIKEEKKDNSELIEQKAQKTAVAEKKKTSSINSGLRDVYDDKIEALTRTIKEKEKELETLQVKNENLKEEKLELETKVKNLAFDLDQEKVFNLWLHYRSTGQLKREELISNDFNFDKEYEELRSIVDPAEKAIREHELNKKAICSGSFFQDFHQGNSEIKRIMVRNIERKEKVIPEQYRYGKAQSEINKIVNLNNNADNTYDLIYRTSREMAKKEGINIKSADFDVEYWRAKARNKLRKEGRI